MHMEDRFPIVDILQQTPAIPDDCQWALFLRNHDELTLEMVTDEERDYMYRVYAHDPQARINLGIRRRLAPLLGNDRRRIELMNGLLFSLPGTPVIYYGDEIGMGDNIYLGDRNGVRTPMQWSADRNAGFSRANPQQLYLPVIIDPEYHYEAVNVEAQQDNPHSLLWWMKRLIALRKRYKAFGRGTLEFLQPEQPQGPRLRAPLRGRAHPGRRQPVALRRSTSSSTCPQFEGTVAGRAVRPARAFPPIGDAAVLPHARAARVLLVLALDAAAPDVPRPQPRRRAPGDLPWPAAGRPLLEGAGRGPRWRRVLPALPAEQPLVRRQGAARSSGARIVERDPLPLRRGSRPCVALVDASSYATASPSATCCRSRSPPARPPSDRRGGAARRDRRRRGTARRARRACCTTPLATPAFCGGAARASRPTPAAVAGRHGRRWAPRPTRRSPSCATADRPLAPLPVQRPSRATPRSCSATG